MVTGGIGTYRFSQFAFRDTNGYPMGTDSTPDVVSAGATTHAYLYDKPVEIGGLGVTYATREMMGGGRVWSRKVSGVSGFSNPTLTLSGFDTTLDAYFKGTTVDTTTNSNWTITPRNIENPNPPQFVSLHSFEFDKDDGSTWYLNHVKLNAQFVDTAGKGGAQADGTNPSPITYEVVQSRSARTVWGELLSASNLDVYQDNDYEFDIISQYPLGLSTYVKDGATATFTLGYRPSSATVGDHIFFSNGTAETPSTVNASTGVVTLSGAGTSGHILVALYQTSFVAI